MNPPHVPVLLNEVLQAFEDIKSGAIVDCTLGYGGHSSAILEQNQNVNLIACDQDEEAIKFSSERLKKFGQRTQIFKSKFSEILGKVEQGQIRGILADIGVSSLQLDKNERGFGLKSENLDMRMDVQAKFLAYDVVNSYSAKELERIFADYGELPNPAKFAAKIVEARQSGEIKSAERLAQIIGLNGVKGRSVSAATLAFQAIRIEVNNELGELQNLLQSIEDSQIDECIVAIISFHSLEDRIVKNKFRQWAQSCICPPQALRCTCGGDNALGKIVSKKAITPSTAEVKANPRSSCAKMRIFKISRGKNAK
ncbi:16S rRNA (cytosine(1402)-N(4))-methyltransferase RsmH [Campylobacter showae]|uniref:16S rRNA (cytosine(1402)-N(4))-methyltransferase RsmH n=1 Tax=Campylobacter showae TaxID=204 RepID=UPI0028D5B11A|nr:16S rRNA (cytosine(1402)-N(4))-methyltransferase RsmH [Campylobacter showae]